MATPIVRKNCFISNNIKLAIVIDIKEKVSEKDLASRHNVSHSTVSRIIDQAFYDYSPNLNSLPKNMCFYEFKSVKSAAGAMSFIFCDVDSHSIIDKFHIIQLLGRAFNKTRIKLMNKDLRKYNNGIIEGINNKIKVIKRIAFGYKSSSFTSKTAYLLHKVC